MCGVAGESGYETLNAARRAIIGSADRMAIVVVLGVATARFRNGIVDLEIRSSSFQVGDTVLAGC
jgi:hypothetical protein